MNKSTFEYLMILQIVLMIITLTYFDLEKLNFLALIPLSAFIASGKLFFISKEH
jgi:hypothetical protein